MCTTLAQLWWQRSSDYDTCSTTREADSTEATDLRDIGILSRAPQPCARFISNISTFIISIITLCYSRTTLDGDDRPQHRGVFHCMCVYELAPVIVLESELELETREQKN